MKSGDFTVHCYVQQGHSFVPDQAGVDRLCNPMVEFSIFNSKKTSQSKKDVECNKKEPITWDEHLFFEIKDKVSQNQVKYCEQDGKEMASELIKVTILNKGLWKREVIGSYVFDIGQIYFDNSNHALEHQLIALNNPEGSDISKITAILRVSIAVVAEGDQKVKLSMYESNGEDEELIIPKSIDLKYKQLQIDFIKGECLESKKGGLKNMFGNSVIYFAGDYSGMKFETEQRESVNQQTMFMTTWKIPIAVPLKLPKMLIKCFLSNKVKILGVQKNHSVDQVGSFILQLNQFLKEESEGKKEWIEWFSITGGPHSSENELGKLMDNQPDIASDWCGRVLLRVTLLDSDDPIKATCATESAISTKCQEMIEEKREFQVQAHVDFGVELPNQDQLSLMIQIGEYFLRTKQPKNEKQGYIRWDDQLTDIYKEENKQIKKCSQILLPYSDLKMLGYIYIYLLNKEEQISFCKIKATELDRELMKQEDGSYIAPKASWRIMKENGSVSGVDAASTGMIRMRLNINDVTKNGPIKQLYQQDNWPITRSRLNNAVKIRAYIFQCRNLPPADDDGLADCQVRIWNQAGDQNIRTKVVNDTLNPIYFECLEFNLLYQDIEDAPPIILNYYDQDTKILGMGEKFDYMGRSIIDLKNDIGFDPQNLKELTLKEAAEIPKPKWFPIYFGNVQSGPSSGEVLASFKIVQFDQAFEQMPCQINLFEAIPRENFRVDMHILGMRDLQSQGIFPVQKPFIELRIKQLIPAEKAQALQNIVTLPGKGSDPNFNMKVGFNVFLPKDVAFFPFLTGFVNDYICAGIKPLIGTFQMSLQKIRTEQVQRNENLKLNLKTLVAQLIQAEQNSDPMNDEEKSYFSQKLSKEQKEAIIANKEFKVLNVGSEKIQLIQEQKFDEKKQIMRQITQVSKQLSKTEEDYRLKIQELQKKSAELKYKGNQNDPERIKIQEELLTEKENFQQLMKQQRKDEKQQKKMKDDQFEIVKLPQYEKNEELKFYNLVNEPSSSIYQKVGYNDAQTIQKLYEKSQEYKRKPKEEQNAKEYRKEIMKLTKVHYRKFYTKELEKCHKIFPLSVFETCDIKKGQSRGAEKGLFQRKVQKDQSGQISTEKVIGKFKSLVEISVANETEKDTAEIDELKSQVFEKIQKVYSKMNEEKKLNCDQNDLFDLESLAGMQNEFSQCRFSMDLLYQIVLDNSIKDVKKLLQKKDGRMVNLFVVEGINLARRDIFSESDPYLKVIFGSKVISDRENYKLDDANPQFNKTFSFNTYFPCAPLLKIQVYDYDDLFADDLIGETVIDLDDRLYNPYWRALPLKPIETRSLMLKESNSSQGSLRMWLNLKREQDTKYQLGDNIELNAEPNDEFQIRLSVFNTKGIPAMDVEGTSDVYITAQLDGKVKNTDTHLRCKDGCASFNYRMLFDVKTPRQETKLSIKAYDRDLFQSNEFICEWKLDLQQVLLVSQQLLKPMCINKKLANTKLGDQGSLIANKTFENDEEDEGTFWLTEKVNIEGKEYECKVRLDLRILPRSYAEMTKVGEARNEPNMEPFLPPPEGRLELQLNPFKMLDQLVSPEFKRRICCWCCAIGCGACLCVILCLVAYGYIMNKLVKL